MKKSNFVALILGTVGCVFFALGMCMCLIQEWGVSRQGIVCGAAGLVVLRQGRGGRGRGRSPPGSGRRGGPGHPERFRGAGRPDRRHRGQRRRRPELHRRRAGRRPELPEQPDGPVKRPFRTNCRPLPALLHSVKKVPAGHVVQPGPFLVCLARGRLASGFRSGGADQWVPFAGASIFSSRMSSMQMRCSWVIGSFATAPIEMLRTACSSVGQFIWKVTA